MAHELTARAYNLFKAALDRPLGERQSFLAQQADPEAAALAAQMLSDYTRPSEAASWQPEDLLGLNEWARSREGTKVGDWDIEEELPSGGYGRVYRASRPIPGGQGHQAADQAAIKFLDVSPTEIARFNRERQLLADLDHEGICRFIDGGTTDGGVPYLVMEYVSGLPINRYCDRHGLTVSDRLRIFIKLCEAVEYAHHQGVLHRDLKPANILVTLGGTVRVLDFGIAKILNADIRADSLTRPGDTLGTKCFASPEQANSGALTFATDVYALGVVLYNLVTGELPLPPYALESPDWRCVLSEREPLPPSEVLLGCMGETSASPHRLPPETASALRGTSPSRLKRTLAGDLDAVILKALRKAPADRYARVEQLRLEIERFLLKVPVTARRAGRWERTHKWVARNRGATIAITITALFVLGEFTTSLPDQIEYQTALHSEDDAIRRLQYLAATGLPSVGKAMPRGDDHRGARLAIVKLHSAFLRKAQSLPEHIVKDIEHSLALSALECGRQWKDLGDPRFALDATTALLARVARRYEADPMDRSRRELYADFLRQRMDLHASLRMEAEALNDARLLSAIEIRER